ncbi:hypothetical protein Sfulv_54570 [Streptomyces fulvorobeus]|uniref:Uncharacterized protein n=1 Tax=Streptomyces fulvorobeus TaxID=284028 RepID=A0A7J0CG00_9ACTN|nr:hypothetical protein [Streptomyces fulvorobeus]GFN00647.1 hypothetical protein Sfulv_54570 [Streptomyces fulvorobeus]
MTADVALRARIVLRSGEGRRRKDVAESAGVSPGKVHGAPSVLLRGVVGRAVAMVVRIGDSLTRDSLLGCRAA